jgi:hypothetical protein
MHKVSDGWSAASQTSSSLVWYRKLKNGDESDIDAVYTASDVEEQIQADTDSESIEYDFDQNEEALEPWLDNQTQETPYHSGW